MLYRRGTLEGTLHRLFYPRGTAEGTLQSFLYPRGTCPVHATAPVLFAFFISITSSVKCHQGLWRIDPCGLRGVSHYPICIITQCPSVQSAKVCSFRWVISDGKEIDEIVKITKGLRRGC